MGNPSDERRPVLPSIVWKKGGPHTVVFEVFSPNKLRRSFTVDICDFG